MENQLDNSKKTSNKKPALIIIAVCFALFLCLISICAFTFVMYRSGRNDRSDNTTNKSDSTQKVTNISNQKWEFPSNYTKDYYDASLLKDYVADGKEVIPKFSSKDELEKKYDLPMSFDYSAADKDYVDQSDYIVSVENMYGMTVPYRKNLNPVVEDTVISGDKETCIECASSMAATSSKVEFNKYASKEEIIEMPYRITFQKEVCAENKDFEETLVRSSFYDKTKLNTRTTFNHYYLGRVDTSTKDFKKISTIYWIEDEEGEIDEYSRYVISYHLEDNYGNKFRNSVAGYKKDLDEYYDEIASMFSRFKSSKDVFAVYDSKCDRGNESNADYGSRVEKAYKKVSDSCISTKKCKGYEPKKEHPSYLVTELYDLKDEYILDAYTEINSLY